MGTLLIPVGPLLLQLELARGRRKGRRKTGAVVALVSRGGRRIEQHSPVIQNLQHAKALRAEFGCCWHNVVALVGNCRLPKGLESEVPGDGLIAALEEIARKPIPVPAAEVNAKAWEAMAAADAAVDKGAARREQLAALAGRHAA